MRPQWPRFSSKSEPNRAQDPCTARIGLTRHMTSSVLTGFNSASDTANPNKSHMLGNAMKNAMVSSLAATLDARWRAWIDGL
ncbi:hypothetical protein TIFTF001_045147 [Ficus carica]|uniref:Uncharacterized protein n=1 Tax=Ficus carica TaxID=3494 RepID=A0AA87YUF2_FICCA|nr:hypothetical protein TIFTF001_045147 [Ficus carica]